ncbi:MAG: putative multidrug export ATP-binding/permease protein [Firmicutes bacterium ADurb.Bin248]|nr:MAG: putative multidrug export ATP-binding/permease protein [Firmicutes bacterium ADurb.Bin248]HOG01289.1 ABC transporter ATP-binding protein [Clostridia bacterium]
MSFDKKPSRLRSFLSYYKPYKGLLLADLLCSLSVAALALVLPVCVRYITKDMLQSGANDMLGEIVRIGAIMIAVILAQTAFAFFYDYKGHDMGAKIERDMRRELFAHYQKLPFSFFDNQKTGQLISRLTNDLLNLAELYHHGPEDLIIYGTQFVGSLIILLCINWKLALVVCAFLPVMALYSFVFYRKLRGVYRQSHERIADVNARAEENLSGIRVVKSFAAEEFETAKFARENDRFYRSRSSIYKHEALYYTGIELFFTQLITVAIIVAGGVWIAGGTLAPADLLVFILYAAYLTGPAPKLAFMVQLYQDGFAGYRRFREIMEITPDIRDAQNAVELKVARGRVSFEHVSFRYGEDQEYVLRDIDLDVRPGETVAIVGRSGIGKTTLCSLIPRFYDASEGDIRIDGASVRDVTLNSLRRQIGVVRQETFLFAGTIMENILYGRPEATAEEAVEAARRANAHGFIMELPDGYETDIGQRGVKLSGGQQQRISIARAFLKNPPILIFDEATSALDYESERAVMDSLKTLARGRTTFIIAHRLSTIRNADRIVVLAQGGIVEQGAHDALYAMDGAYAKLYNANEA